MADFEIAQLNIGRLVAPTDSPIVAEFMDALDHVNALADAAPGFVWRFQTEEGNATAERFFEDDLVIVNFSTWTSVDLLADFVYHSAHTTFLRRRREWFDRMEEIYSVLWWVPAGHRPAFDEALERLEHLHAQGPTDRAFSFRHRFDEDGTSVGSDPATSARPEYGPSDARTAR